MVKLLPEPVEPITIPCRGVSPSKGSRLSVPPSRVLKRIPGEEHPSQGADKGTKWAEASPVRVCFLGQEGAPKGREAKKSLLCSRSSTRASEPKDSLRSATASIVRLRNRSGF